MDDNYNVGDFLKNVLDRVNYRLDTAEENISELENVATEMIQNKTQKKIFLNKKLHCGL